MVKHLFAVSILALASSALAEGQWEPLFNGKNLDGWIVKINGHEVGKNPGNMFRVEDGLLSVSYADFWNETFKDEFGHIHTDKPYTNYRFRCEYRFLEGQVSGAPKWAYANSGIMLNCPHPEKMALDQKFPDSAEFQLLGDTRTTGSLFTPGSMVTYKNQADMSKSIKSTIPARPFGEWVKAEAVVQDGKIQHWINGELVMEYSNHRLLDGTAVTGGYISLQAESHPVQFRNIEILQLD